MLMYAKLIIVFISTKIFALFRSNIWKCNIQADEGLTKIKEKWSTIKFDVFILSFIFFCDHTDQMEKNVLENTCFNISLESYLMSRWNFSRCIFLKIIKEPGTSLQASKLN